VSEEFPGNGLDKEDSHIGEILIGDWKSNAWPGNSNNVTYLPLAAKEDFTSEMQGEGYSQKMLVKKALTLTQVIT
jgi:hypothetical protein